MTKHPTKDSSERKEAIDPMPREAFSIVRAALGGDPIALPAFDAIEASFMVLVSTLKTQRERLEDEAKIGPTPNICPNPDCGTISCGTGYTSCPGCGGALEYRP